MTAPDFIGFVGVACVLICFFLVQVEKMSATSIAYQVLNMLGCVLILISLYFSFNFPSAIIQVIWFLISFFGLVRNVLKVER